MFEAVRLTGSRRGLLCIRASLINTDIKQKNTRNASLPEGTTCSIERTLGAHPPPTPAAFSVEAFLSALKTKQTFRIPKNIYYGVLFSAAGGAGEELSVEAAAGAEAGVSTFARESAAGGDELLPVPPPSFLGALSPPGSWKYAAFELVKNLLPSAAIETMNCRRRTKKDKAKRTKQI